VAVGTDTDAGMMTTGSTEAETIFSAIVKSRGTGAGTTEATRGITSLMSTGPESGPESVPESGPDEGTRKVRINTVRLAAVIPSLATGVIEGHLIAADDDVANGVFIGSAVLGTGRSGV
jgi:hypothetical protein